MTGLNIKLRETKCVYLFTNCSKNNGDIDLMLYMCQRKRNILVALAVNLSIINFEILVFFQGQF